MEEAPIYIEAARLEDRLQSKSSTAILKGSCSGSNGFTKLSISGGTIGLEV